MAHGMGPKIGPRSDLWGMHPFNKATVSTDNLTRVLVGSGDTCIVTGNGMGMGKKSWEWKGMVIVHILLGILQNYTIDEMLGFHGELGVEPNRLELLLRFFGYLTAPEVD